MSEWMASVVMALSIAFTGAIVEWVARQAHPRRLFFVSLGRVRRAGDAARARRVRLVNAGATLGGILAALVGPPALGALAVTVCPLVSTGWLVGELIGAARSAQLGPVPGRFAVPLAEPPPLRDYVSVPLQLANVLLVVIPAALFAWLATRLPSRVPMHWGASGEVNRWGHPSELWTLGGMLVFDLLLLWGIAWAIAKERWVLPESDAERYAELQLERRRLLVRMLEWTMASVNAGMAILWLGLAASGLPGWEDRVGPAVAGSLGVMIVGVLGSLVWLTRRLMPVADELKRIAGTEVLGTRSSGWRYGGLVYYAPEDPAVFVPKRVGIGQTLNFARPSAWILLGLVLAVPLAIALVGALLAR